ncbi:MAG: SagB/ThcOx family dehydrogenase [Methanocellales archaeon]|nr:SagB/ThcOx family dehydrogenase [Methanocellales archaeon]
MLPAPKLTGEMSLEEAIKKRRSRRSFRDVSLRMDQLSQILWAAQGITERFKRAAPSAGATYPLDLYIVAGKIEGLETGVYHYDPSDHSISLHAEGDLRTDLARACVAQGFIADAPVSMVITAEYERTMQRYEERGIRYVHIEAGHVGQNIYLQAEALGLGTVAIGAFYDDEVAKLLHLPEEHQPLYVMPVGYVMR